MEEVLKWFGEKKPELVKDNLKTNDAEELIKDVEMQSADELRDLYVKRMRENRKLIKENNTLRHKLKDVSLYMKMWKYLSIISLVCFISLLIAEAIS